MKKLTSTILAVSILLLALGVITVPRDGNAVTKYSPIVDFIDLNSTLGEYYKQYIDTTSGKKDIEDFLKRLSKSGALLQRYKRAGLTHNQLYAPIVTLLGIALDDINNLTEGQMATVRLSMVELDMALLAIMSTVVQNAQVEFRNEVLRMAPPLSEVAGLPPSAVETMKTLTVPEHKVSDRLNNPNPYLKIPPSRDAEGIVRPSNITTDYYNLMPTGKQ